MRIILFCATQRGYLVLKRLLDLASEHELTVFSFKEQPWEPPFLENIRNLALQSNADFFEAKQIHGEHLRDYWENTSVDLILAVSWRYMIPRSIYSRAKLGAFIFHDSLLPVYRGFSPTVWAMINGETYTGGTLFEIAEAVDSGPIIDQQKVMIGELDTIQTVMDRVTETYIDLLEKHLPDLLRNAAPRLPQDHTKATYTCKRIPEDNLIDWVLSSAAVYNLIRAVTQPYPGAFTFLNGRRLKVWAAEKIPYGRYVGRVCGRVVEIRPGTGTVVLTGDSALLLTRVQFENEPIQIADSVIDSLSMTLGK